MPGIEVLTESVKEGLTEDNKIHISNLVQQIDEEKETSKATIEDVLNKIRLIRELTHDKSRRSYCNISGDVAKKLDIEICNSVYRILSTKEENIISNEHEKYRLTQKLFAWLNMLNGDHIKEIFTANYDLIFEKAMEKHDIPYFDGFIGAYEPFFYPESVEDKGIKNCVPLSWIRLWKIHGSLGWFWKKENDKYRVIRLGVKDKCEDNNELVIYPSKEKYESSRKQPFITYFDRMKSHLTRGEGIFIISGYSFADEHINELIFESLRRNNKIHIMVYLFKDEELEKIQGKAVNYLNMSVYSPKKAIIGGRIGEWEIDNSDNDVSVLSYWNEDKEEFTLGDFSKLVNFLVDNSGCKPNIEKKIGVKNE